jgi:hypothetical protein
MLAAAIEALPQLIILKFVLGEAAEGVAALKAAEFASAYVPLPFLRVCLPSPLQIIVVLL